MPRTEAAAEATLRQWRSGTLSSLPLSWRRQPTGRAARHTATGCASQATCCYLADRLRRRRGTDSLAELATLADKQGAPQAALKTLQRIGARELTACYGHHAYATDEADTLPSELDRAVEQIEAAHPSRKL